MSTKTMKEKATELLQRCEVVVLASVNKEGYPRPVPMSKIATEGISTIWMSTGADSLKTIDFRTSASRMAATPPPAIFSAFIQLTCFRLIRFKICISSYFPYITSTSPA